MRHSTILLSLVLVAILAAPALAHDSGTSVSVGIFSGRHASACTIASQSVAELQLGSADPVSLPAGATVTLKVAGGLVRVVWSGAEPADSSIVMLSSPDTLRVSLVGVKPRAYRGSLLVTAKAGALVFVNRVDLEDYLRGTVPAEMPPKFAPEALKAQAIAARTYTIAHLGRHQAEGFDLCDGVHCQVYSGADREDARVDAAIAATAGLIVTYEGRPITAVYHDTCGGETAAGEEAWATKTQTPYLRPVSDIYQGVALCAASPKAYWKRQITQEQLAAALAKYGVIAPLLLIRPIGCEDGTRPDRYCLLGEKGQWTVPAAAIRNEANRVLGADSLPSADFVADISGHTITFLGWGNGHGVGLCQWGANGLAKRGKSATEILAHYYTGVQVQPLSTAIAAK